MASSLSFFSSSIFLPHSTTNKHNNIIFNNNNKSFLPCPPWRSSSSSIRSELTSATLPVLSFTGETLPTTVTISLNSAPRSTARSVVHRALVHDQQNARRGTASTLTRAEVRGGGKKPYAQKKTGNARRGSQRTPLRPGGGVIFGPKPKDWSIKMNRKEKRLAISTAIASAIADGDALVVVEDSFAEEFEKMDRPKTREFVEAMRRWGLDPKDKATFLTTEVPDNLRLSCRNIGTLKMLTPRTLNLFDILDAEKLVLTTSAVDYLNAMYGGNTDFDEDDDAKEIEKDSNPNLVDLEEDVEAEGGDESS